MRVYVVITRDRAESKEPGYHFTLRDGLHRQRPMMQSAKLPTEHKARIDAERLFGPLAWVAPITVGITSDYVTLVAAIEATPAEVRAG